MMNLKSTGSSNSKSLTWERFLTYIVGFFILFGMFLIWPFGIIRNDEVSKSIAETDKSTGPITWDVPIIQEFVPQHDFIDSIEISVDRNEGQSTAGRFYFKVFNQQLELVKTYEMNIVDLEDKRYTEMPLSIRVEKGQTYYFRIEVKYEHTTPPKLCYRTLSGAGPIENKTFYYGSEVLPDASASVRYHYKSDLRLTQILTYDAFILFAGLLLLDFLKKRFGRQLSGSVKADMFLRTVVAAGGSICLFFCFYYLVIRKIFGGTGWDMAVYSLASVFGFLLWNYGVYHISWRPVWERMQKKEWWISAFQAICFAVIGVASAFYFNSGSNYGHAVGTRYILIAFGIVLLCYFKKKEFLSKTALISYAAGAVGCIFYYIRFFKEVEKQHLFHLNAVTVLVFGILLILLVRRALLRELPRVSRAFGLLLLLFFILLIVFRNTRTWVFTLTVPFTLFYLIRLDKEETDRLLEAFCNGLLLSFAYLMGKSVLFRPYYSHNYARYPGWFFSVATAAIYEVAVFGAALVKVVAKMQVSFFRDQEKKRGIRSLFRCAWKELILFAVVVSFLMLSLSRTALLSVAVTALCVFAVTEWFCFRDRLLLAISRVAVFFLALGLLFPVVYTTTRCLPALVSRPYIMEQERFKGTIEAGEKIDSYRYMDFRRYLDLSAEKIMRYLDEYFGGEDSEESADREYYLALGGENGVNQAEAELLLASAEEQPEEPAEESPDQEVSNGRMEIFSAYLKELNMTGHDTMLIYEEDNPEEPRFFHAHNSYLQTAYDHGILTAIVFLLLCAVAWIRSILVYQRFHKQMPYSIASLIMITCFGVASLTEWVFHPCIVLGFACFFVWKPLLFCLKERNAEKENE